MKYLLMIYGDREKRESLPPEACQAVQHAEGGVAPRPAGDRTTKVAAQLGAQSVRRADPAFVNSATGQVIGGVAPAGHPRPVRTLVDVWRREHAVVWAAGGHARMVFPTSFAELVRITAGMPADVG